MRNYTEQQLKLPIIMIPNDQKVKEDWFLEILRAQQIEYAIDFLQIETSLLTAVPRVHFFHILENI